VVDIVLDRAESQGHAAPTVPRGRAAPPARPGRGLSPASVLALQATAGNRATTRRLQRAIVAIDGDNDSAASKRATQACLWNLRYTKKGKEFADGGARGQVAGPAKRRRLRYDMSNLLASDSESLYVLAHGSRYEASIAGMDPTEMAAWLRRRFAKRRFTGKVKLVSCHSGADKSHRRPGDEGKGIYPFDRAYAQELAQALAPRSRKDKFRPSSVQGIVGIGWVDEFTGSITAINKEAYDRAMAQMDTNSDVGALAAAGKRANPFTERADPALRGQELRAEFGTPVHVDVHHPGHRDDSADPAALHFGKGHWGKRTFEVGTGDEL
jgi:hypothetical protein